MWARMSSVETDLHYDAKARVLVSPSGRPMSENLSLDEAAREYPGQPIRVLNSGSLAEAHTRHASASRMHT